VSWLRARVVVAGRVQGVWFRESTRRRAAELGVGGWVRNLPDGRVEALFEGPDDRVRAAIAFVKVGPPLARVSDVAVAEEAPGDALRAPAAFEIR
jgi:acylphosphatase